MLSYNTLGDTGRCELCESFCLRRCASCAVAGERNRKKYSGGGRDTHGTHGCTRAHGRLPVPYCSPEKCNAFSKSRRTQRHRASAEQLGQLAFYRAETLDSKMQLVEGGSSARARVSCPTAWVFWRLDIWSDGYAETPKRKPKSKPCFDPRLAEGKYGVVPHRFGKMN